MSAGAMDLQNCRLAGGYLRQDPEPREDCTTINTIISQCFLSFIAALQYSSTPAIQYLSA